MMSYFMLFLLIGCCIQNSLQYQCKMEVYSPPFTDCEHPRWVSVTFMFGPENADVTLPMSSVCRKESTASFAIDLDCPYWIENGNLSLLLNVNGVRHEKIESEWFVETISVSCNMFNSSFGIGRPIIGGRVYDFNHFDTSTASIVDEDQRLKEIGINKARYTRNKALPGGPLIINGLNKEEQYETDVLQMKTMATFNQSISLPLKYGPQIMKDPEFKSLKEIETFLSEESFPEKEVIKFWKEDEWFAAQRLMGQDPAVITAIHKIPKIFKMDRQRAEAILKGDLNDALASGRIFIADLEILGGIDEYWSPMAMFFVNEGGNLQPLAIQLTRNGKTDQVFYPDDNANAWLLAKMYYNGLEGLHHQMVIHFGWQHVLLDHIGILLYNYVSPRHPVFKLLKPHLYQMFGNNINGANRLLGPGGVFDRMITGGRYPAIKLLIKGMDIIDFNHINPVRDNQRRKTATILVYPFRDRGIPIYNEIRRYVGEILEIHFPCSKRPDDDLELRQWRRRLALSPTSRGAGIKNLPGNDKSGKMTVDNLADILATFIWIATAGHATVNNPQYQQYSFIPNYPIMLRKSPPTSKENITEEYILECIGNKMHALLAIVSSAVLVDDGGGPHIGHFERQFLYSPQDQAAIKRFQDRLELLKGTNYPSLKYPYRFLDIGTIRNSVRV